MLKKIECITKGTDILQYRYERDQISRRRGTNRNKYFTTGTNKDEYITKSAGTNM
jgi:hypothetical protein